MGVCNLWELSLMGVTETTLVEVFGRMFDENHPLVKH